MGSLINGFEAFNKQADDLKFNYPELCKVPRNGKNILSGNLPLIDGDGVIHDKFEIEIHPVPGYPFRFPYVFETGGRIPRNIDWHIFENDGHCCLRSIPDELLICKKGIDLHSFIETEVKPYFYNQTHRDKFGYYLNERSHGLLGELEFFFDNLRTSNLLEVVRHLTFVSKRQEPSRTENCYCGSGEKYRRCHRDAFTKLVTFSDYELRYFRNNIITSEAFINAYPILAYQLIARENISSQGL